MRNQKQTTKWNHWETGVTKTNKQIWKANKKKKKKKKKKRPMTKK